jgi:tetratricopeptide (TPR) repeat protein
MLYLLLLLAFAQEVPPPTIPALVAEGNAAYLKGNYDAAQQSFLKAWEFAQQTPNDDPQRYDILKRLVRIRSAGSDFEDADRYLQMAINWRENLSGTNDLRLVDDLLVSVQLCRGMKNFDRAILIVNRVMGIHRVNGGTETAFFADDLSRMGQIYMEQKEVVRAIGMFHNAVEIREKLGGPLDPSLIYDLDRLAGAHIVQREYDQAEAAYRHSLIIRESLLGKNDPDLIATVDGLAYSLFGQKKFDEAEPLYQRLIGLWEKSVGDDHPMVAIALEKVARFYAEQKKFDQSREYLDKGIAIRAHFMAEGLAAAAAEQLTEGSKDGAIASYKRALAVMDPPHPVYDEMRGEMETLVKAMTAPAKAAPKKAAPPPKK